MGRLRGFLSFSGLSWFGSSPSSFLLQDDTEVFRQIDMKSIINVFSDIFVNMLCYYYGK